MEMLKTYLSDSIATSNPQLSEIVGTRINKLRQWAQSVRESQPSDDRQWQECVAMIDYQCLSAKKFLQGIYQMPGVTGESNELWIEPRGLSAVIIDEDMPAAAISGMISAALLCRNKVKVAAHPQLKPYAEGMLKQLMGRFVAAGEVSIVSWEQKEQLLNEPELRIVALGSKNNELIISLNRQLAMRDGIIVPLICETDPYLTTINNASFCINFGVEKTCTINTTAIGGNASLLELGATAAVTKN